MWLARRSGAARRPMLEWVDEGIARLTAPANSFIRIPIDFSLASAALIDGSSVIPYGLRMRSWLKTVGFLAIMGGLRTG